MFLRTVTAAAGLALLISACGDDAASDQARAAADPSREDARADPSGADVLAVEVLTVDNDDPSTLRAAVTGDRPVLLWFYAPH